MAKAKSKAKGGKKKERPLRQTVLPGAEPPKIDEIEEAAQDYVTSRDLRMAEQAREITRSDTLLRLMKEHKLDVYEMQDGRVVRLTALEKVKVKRPKKKKEDGESDHESNGDTEE